MQVIHEDLQPHRNPPPSSTRAFGIVIAIAFSTLGAGPLLAGGSLRVGPFALGMAFLVAALLRPGTLDPLARAWLRLGLVLHRVVSPLTMGVLLYGVLTPIGLLMRLAGADPLRLRRDSEADTYWISRPKPDPSTHSMRNQF